MQPYSLLITACDRDDLLLNTVKSLLKTADIKPREIIIVNDGHDRPMPQALNQYKHLGLKWLCNGVRRGQIYSCDRLWSECKNEIAFWCEDDWNFVQGDFIQKSFDILSSYPEVLTVTLRGDWNHPLITDSRFPCKIATPAWKGVWGGFTFNPGLRRKSDWRKIGSYGRVTGYGTHGLGHEIELSKLYASMGMVLGALPDRCVHTGGGRSRAVEPLQFTPAKVLIAVPACHKFEYGAWESERSPNYDKSKAWQGKPYGTDIHISGTNPRIQAVRETWAKDCTHKNLTMKFFYGIGSTPMLDDEVRLPVPDDYEHLPQKTIAICKWALDNGFDYVLKCDDDSYVWVDRAMLEVNQVGDFAGYINGGSCSGGCGYWLSNRAMSEVIRNPINTHWAEDVTVGMIMKAAKIEPQMLQNHVPGFSNHWFDIDKVHSDMVCIHAVKPEDMRELYRREHEAQTVR